MQAMRADAGDGGDGAGGLDTSLKGDPAAVHHAAAWAGSHAKAIDTAADSCASARGHAASGWSGVASDAFIAQMGRYVKDADAISDMSRNASRALGDYATHLESAQKALEGIRERARGAGLTVAGDTILSPGPGPALPDDPPTGSAATQQAVQSYNSAVTSYNAAQAKISAYNQAAVQLQDVQVAHGAAVINLSKELAGLWDLVQEHNGKLNAVDNAFTTAATLLTGAWAKFSAVDADRAADNLMSSAERAVTAVTEDPAGYGALEGNRILDEAGQTRLDAGDMRAVGEEADGLGVARGIKLGGAFAIVGTGLDIANGERVDQAAVSNVAGFGSALAVGTAADAGATLLASTAAGAAMGSAVPIVGTAVGALAGAVVGTFATGAVASLWDDHPSLAHAWDKGAETVEDTVKAVGDVASSAGSAIADGAKSAWHSIFG